MARREEVAKLGDGGRILIPVEFRRALGLDIGDDIILILEEGRLHLLPRKEAIRQAQALAQSYVPTDVSLSAELIADRRKEATND